MHKNYQKKFSKKLKKSSFLMTLLPLSACSGGSSGGGGGGSTPPPPTPAAEFIEEPTGVFIALDDRATTLDQASATTDLTVTGKGGADVINTGSGADAIDAGGGSDKIRSGAGADTVNAGAGNDAIVLIGVTSAGQYEASDISSAGNGFNLSSLITAAEINGNPVSDVVAGDVIDGGSGTDTLFIYGTVDLTGVTISNVTILEIHSVVTLTPDQLAQFTTINGDGSSVINIVVPAGDTYVLDLTAIDITDISTINIDGDLTVKISDQADLSGISSITSTGGSTITLDVVDGGSDTTIALSVIADTFDDVDTITLDTQVTLTVDDPADITDLGLNNIDGTGDIETDGSGAVDTALDTLTLAPSINAIPIAVNDTDSSTENQSITVDVLANDLDGDNDTLTLTAVSVGAGQGSVSIVDNKLLFTPGTDFDDLATDVTEDVIINYTLSDGDATDSGSLTITVTGTNDVPTLTVDTDDANENEVITVDVLANDTDKDDDLTLTAVSVGAGQGSVSIVEGKIKFDPGTDFDDLANGITEDVIINYSAFDGTVIENSTLTITVTGTNDAPVAVDDTANADENSTVSVDVLLNDDDEENDTLTITAASVADGDGSVSIVDGKIQYSTDTDFEYLGTAETEEITVTYTVSDGEKSDEGSLVVTVYGTNDAPVVSGNVDLEVLENGELIITEADLLANATDVDTQIQILSVVNLALLGSGTLIDNNNGTWTYTPEANTFGEVSLTYDVFDDEDTTAATADLTINEITFTIPYGDFASTVLHFNDPLLLFQSNLLGYRDTYFGVLEEVAHINLLPVWEEYSGAGIMVGSVENIDYTHPELESTYLVDHYLSYDPLAGLQDGTYHGTATAGIISAGADNGIGLVGIAYGSSITSFYVQDETGDRFDVVTNSTGTAGNLFFGYDGDIYSQKIVADTYAQAAVSGRGGFGTIHVISVGNGSSNDGTTEVSAYNTLFELMPIGLLNVDGLAAGSFYGSSIHLTAPLSSFDEEQRALSLDRYGDLGFISETGNDTAHSTFDPHDYFSTLDQLGYDFGPLGLDTGGYLTIGGSSGAAPVVAAATALVLEASENNIFNSSGLGWRDVQEIFALSASHTGIALSSNESLTIEHGYWTINGSNNFNGGGMHFSPDYGFGMLDVHAAVRLTETWSLQHTSSNMVTHDVVANSADTIEYGTVVEMTLDLSGYSDLDLDVVSFDLDITHDNWSEMLITIISPDGTESIVFDTPGLTATSFHEQQIDMTEQLQWEVLSRAFWNENTSGTWTIRIEDVVNNGNSGSVGSITAHFKGDLNTDDDTYFFTDDWSKMNEANGGVPTLDDSAGVNTINASPVSDDVTLDMSAGSTSQIGGINAFSLSATTAIDIGITGDGDDTIRGIDTGDSVYAMRGDDVIEITATDFALIDGYRGEDTLILDGTNITLDLSVSTITNMEVIDLTGSGNNSLTLTLQDLIDATDEDNLLIIDGNTGDSVSSTAEGWTQGADQVIGIENYHTYTVGSGTLLIDDDVTQTIS